MMQRIGLLGDIHGNLAALEAALEDVRAAAPDRIAFTGDYVLNGPRPAEVVERVRALEAEGAVVVQGNTDVAVADFDYAAAFPWLDEVPSAQRAAVEWAHAQLSEEQLDWLRRLPAERRLSQDGTMLLVCHAAPGSQTQGLPADLDPATTLQLVTRTDARVIGCGHTHAADVREVGRKLICNAGSCGYAFDGDPRASWAIVTLAEEPWAELRRTEYDPRPVSDELSTRGLPGDVYRAATIRTGRYVR